MLGTELTLLKIGSFRLRRYGIRFYPVVHNKTYLSFVQESQFDERAFGTRGFFLPRFEL